MAFTQTCKSIVLHDTILSAECRTEDDTWKSSYLDLNQHLGNSNGSFWLSGARYFESATSVRLDGHLLRASLRRIDGEYNEASLDLTLCVENVNGNLRFKKTNKHILSSCSGFVLKGSVLEALCLGVDGKMHSSSIDLDECYSNHNGNFFPGATHFARTARNFALRVTSGALLFSAELRSVKGEWVEAETDLALRIANKDGRGKLTFVCNNVWTDEEHSLTRFFEHVPCVDYTVEDIYAKRDEDDAKRTLVHCAKSSSVAASLILSARCGGPVAVSIGASLAHPIFLLSDTPIDDPELRLLFEQAIIGHYLHSTLRTLLPPGAAAAIANTISSLSQEGFETACTEVASALAERVSTEVAPLANVKSYLFLKKVAESLVRGDVPHEWKAAIKKVRDIRNAGATKVKDREKHREGHTVHRSSSAGPGQVSPPPPYTSSSASSRRDTAEKSSSSSSSKSNPSRSDSNSSASAPTSAPSIASWRARHDGLSLPSNSTLSPASVTPASARVQLTPPATQQMEERQRTSLVFGGMQRSDKRAHSSYSSYL